MVKGVSKQVIVVHSPEEKLFEQAIFILNEQAVGPEGVTDEALMKQARKLIGVSAQRNKKSWLLGPVWAFGGALITGAVWLVTTIF